MISKFNGNAEQTSYHVHTVQLAVEYARYHVHVVALVRLWYRPMVLRNVECVLAGYIASLRLRL